MGLFGEVWGLKLSGFRNGSRFRGKSAASADGLDGFLLFLSFIFLVGVLLRLCRVYVGTFSSHFLVLGSMILQRKKNYEENRDDAQV